MYFSGKLSIDPSKSTLINRIKPSKAFAQLLHVMTAGAFSKKEEEETFTAVSVLQQLNMAFRSIGINNIVRLSKDDLDFYLDEEGKDDDFKQVIAQFSQDTDHWESELFETLHLVVEHKTDAFKFLIEVDINRTHKVGEYPITVSVNGILTAFEKQPGETAEDVKARLNPTFKNQDAYDAFLLENQSGFDHFIDRLKLAITISMKTDDIKTESQAKIIRPKKPLKRTEDIHHHNNSHPAYYGYYGYDDAFFYAYLWSGMSHSHHIHYQNVSVVDEQGQQMFDVGEEGFDTGDSNAMNPEADFEAPEAADISYGPDSEYASEFEDAGITTDDSTNVSDGGESSSWGDFGGDSSDGGSSCGSSCGGGCGGD